MAEQFPLERLQKAVGKFVKVMEIDVDRLNKHKLSIQQVSNTGYILVIYILYTLKHFQNVSILYMFY